MTLYCSHEIGTKGKLVTHPREHVFGWIKFVLAILVEGHSVIFSTKLF